MREFISAWWRRVFPEKTLGQRGEAAAARHLRRRGYKIIALGDRLKHRDELDIVAYRGKTIVFAEVKTRTSSEAGLPSEAVDAAKQRRLTKLAVTFLKASPPAGIFRPLRRYRHHMAGRSASPENRAHRKRLRSRRAVGILFVNYRNNPTRRHGGHGEMKIFYYCLSD